MSDRREYKRRWMSNKRKMLSSKRKQDGAVSLSDDSDSEAKSDNLVITNSVTSPEHNLACSRKFAEDSSNLSDQSSDEDASWDAIDIENENKNGSSESDGEVGSIDLKHRLQAWAVDCGVTHAQLNKLLPILKEVDSSLPLTAKTLLKTSDDFKCSSLSGGDYMYFGVSAGLNVVLADRLDLHDFNKLELALNIDGVPLFKSSTYSLWPVLCYITNVKPHRVFVVAVFGGKSKPCDLEFLEEVVQELNKLLIEGVTINGFVLQCVIKYCVCDAPAKSMVKCTKLYSGYYGCDKCSQRGEYIGRMTYPICDAPSRTDECFRQQSNAEHHNGSSPFCLLPIDMISVFPIDYMHQVCLGVMKRLLVCWTAGSKKVKLSASQKLEVSSRLQSFRSTVTAEFNRKPRSLCELAHWKATEFRTFLLYCGYFVLNKIARAEIVQHFLCLSVALRVLISDTLSVSTEYRTFAHDLLLHFVSKSADIYGPEFLVYNVHSLVHLSKEVETFGKLDNCSAFIFENYMQTLKRYVRSARNPVVQLANRLQEERFYKISECASSNENPTAELQTFSCKPPNNCCIISEDEEGRCCQIVKIEKKRVACMVFNKSEPVFTSPCDSRIVGIHAVKLSNGVMKFMQPNTLACKAMTYTGHSSDHLIFLQLLHSV
jgi:hypothetical protein